MEEPPPKRRRPLLGILVLAISVSLILVGWTLWWAGSSPVTTSYPDFNPPEIVWNALPDTPGSVTADVGGVVGLTFRVTSDSFDPRADRVYVALNRRVVAFDARTGSADWWRSVDNASGPVSANYGDYALGAPDYELFAGTSADLLRIFNDTAAGDPSIRDILVGGRVRGLAAYVSDLNAERAARDLVLAALEGGELVAIGAANHTVLWRTSFASTVRLAAQRNTMGGVPVSSAAFSGDGARVFAVTEDGDAVALNTTTGATLFSFPTGFVTAVPLAFAAQEPRVLIGEEDGFLSIFTEDGVLLGGGRVTDGPITQMLWAGSMVIVISRIGEVSGVVLRNGGTTPAVLWRGRVAGPSSGPPAFDQFHALYVVGDLSGRVTGFRTDGSLAFRVQLCDSVTGGPEAWSPVSFITSLIWVGCGDGSVYALRYRQQGVP